MYDLEIAVSTERLNTQLASLQEHFPSLDVLTKTRYFCIFGCVLEYQLTDVEKQMLEQLATKRIILRFRCGKQR